MSANQSNNGDYSSLKKSGKEKPVDGSDPNHSLKRGSRKKREKVHDAGLKSSSKKSPREPSGSKESEKNAQEFTLKPEGPKASADPKPRPGDLSDSPEKPDHSEVRRREKARKRAERDFELLAKDSWVKRNGHYLTYVGLYCFTILVLYRPYELVPGLGFLGATAFYVAAATVAIFIPVQLSTEGTLTYLSFEVKMVIALTLIALISVPIAKSPRTAWAEFNDIFIKAVLMFVVMVNVLRTRKRLIGMIWLSLGIAVVLSFMALSLYWRGELGVEGYRVGVEIGGMFGNPNDLSLHLVMMVPLAVAMGAAAKNLTVKAIFFAMAGLFVAGLMVTYSRGGFLGIVCVTGFLVWKLGREHRLQVIAIAGVAFVLFIFLAPGNYGMRLLSILDPSLDAVGSRNQRRDLLMRSILVSIRNPWGIGIGNFPIVGIRNLVSHNSYTQVSSELGVAGLAVYLLFILSPFRRLAAIERRLQNDLKLNWFYYLAVGLQASLIGYLVSSFFVSVAYNWFIYYLIAYAVAFRRVYMIEHDIDEESQGFSIKRLVPGLQKSAA